MALHPNPAWELHMDRKLVDHEVTEMQRILKDVLLHTNHTTEDEIMNEEDAADFLAYCAVMVSNAKSVQYVVQELETLIADTATVQALGEQLFSYLQRVQTADSEETGTVTATANTESLTTTQPSNALVMSGALRATREGRTSNKPSESKIKEGTTTSRHKQAFERLSTNPGGRSSKSPVSPQRPADGRRGGGRGDNRGRGDRESGGGRGRGDRESGAGRGRGDREVGGGGRGRGDREGGGRGRGDREGDGRGRGDREGGGRGRGHRDDDGRNHRDEPRGNRREGGKEFYNHREDNDHQENPNSRMERFPRDGGRDSFNDRGRGGGRGDRRGNENDGRGSSEGRGGAGRGRGDDRGRGRGRELVDERRDGDRDGRSPHQRPSEGNYRNGDGGGNDRQRERHHEDDFMEAPSDRGNEVRKRRAELDNPGRGRGWERGTGRSSGPGRGGRDMGRGERGGENIKRLRTDEGYSEGGSGQHGNYPDGGDSGYHDDQGYGYDDGYGYDGGHYDQGYNYPPRGGWRGGYRGGRSFRGGGRGGGRAFATPDGADTGTTLESDAVTATAAVVAGHPSPLVVATFRGRGGGYSSFRGRGRGRGPDVKVMIASKTWVRKKEGEESGGGGDGGTLAE